MAETTVRPTADNTVAEIKAYLDANSIVYNTSATKAELVTLIPDQEENLTTEPVQEPTPVPVPVRQEPYYTKLELLDLISGRQHDYFLIALKKGRTYTYKEALQAVDAWMYSGKIF